MGLKVFEFDRDKEFLKTINMQAKIATKELVEASGIQKGQIFVVGCSSSEIGGYKIGSHSVEEIAESVFDGVYSVLSEKGIYLASQCCEHLNRAVIIDREAAEKYNLEIVNVVPCPTAGGSFATAAYKKMSDAVAVEFIKADAGMDIGSTLIGMHLKAVAVPVRLSSNTIGSAYVTFARTRPRCIGGIRAVYDDSLM